MKDEAIGSPMPNWFKDGGTWKSNRDQIKKMGVLMKSNENSLGLRLAELRIGQICSMAQEPWNVTYHQEAESFDCEERLQKVIDAQTKLQHSEREVRESAKEGLIDLTPELENYIDSLYASLLDRFRTSRKLIDRVMRAGKRPSNLDDFEKSYEEAESRPQQRRLGAWASPKAEFTNADVAAYEALREAEGLPSVTRIKSKRVENIK